MKYLFKLILLIILIVSCHSNTEKTNPKNFSERLTINYTGDADFVQFKMFGGLDEILTRNSITCQFEGIFEIPNLEEAIFTYEIVVYKEDSLGQMIQIAPKSQFVKLNKLEAIENRDRFLWIGKNRNDNYLKNEELKGSLITKSIASEFLGEDREISVYTPKEVDSKTPHIYFTDGWVVNEYAPYIDRLISTNKIRPLKLIGIHSSSSNRYEEYVQGGNDNEQFKKHQKFVYSEVINSVEKEIENWEGKKYLYGVSNGAAFSMHAGLNYPHLFEEIIAFSTADYISSIARIMNPITFNFDKYPKFYMGAGRYEKLFFNDNTKFFDKMKSNEIEVEFKEFISGHDDNVWRIEFLEYIEKRFKI